MGGLGRDGVAIVAGAEVVGKGKGGDVFKEVFASHEFCDMSS